MQPPDERNAERAGRSGELAREHLFGFDTWQELLDTPERLEWLLFVGNHYRELFDDAVANIRNLAWHTEVAYLIDFDVLRSYIEVDSLNRRQAALVYSWFHYSTRPYALPVGALEELMAYLRRMADVGIRVTEARANDMGGEPAVRALAQSLGVPDAESMRSDEAVEEIRSLLDSRAVHLGRLADFLTNERFMGVASEYDWEVAERLRSWISDLPRRKEAGRRVRDERDARNIAIAIESARRANLTKDNEENEPPPTLFLVTGTSILVDLSKTVKHRVLGGHRNAIEFSDTVHDILSKMDGSPDPRHCLDFPIIHPRHGTVAELIGLYDSPREAVTAMKQRRRELWEITEYCEDVLDAKGPSGGVAAESLAQVIAENRDKVVQVLRNFGKQFLGNEKCSLSRLEDNRAAMIAVSRPADFLGNEDRTCRTDDVLREASTRFLAEISRVEARLAGLDAIIYAAVTSKEDGDPPYVAFRVFDQTDPKRPITIASGEMYSTKDGNRDSDATFYVFRFPTYASGAEFLLTIEDVVFPILPAPVTIEAILRPVADVPESWQQGILVHLRDRTLCMPIRERARQAPTGSRTVLDTLTELVASLRVRRYQYGRCVDSMPTIEQYRVNTLRGDYLFDVEPEEGEIRKYCTIMSDVDLAEPIAELYSRLGNRYVLREKLVDVLASALEQCRQIIYLWSEE